MSKIFNKKRLDQAFIRVYRESARLEQNCQCDYCYEPLTFKTNTADHVKAQKNKGNNSKENIVACCKPCNQAKGHMSVAQFKKTIKSFPSGKPWPFMMAWSRRRINLALNRMEKHVMEAVNDYSSRNY